MNTAAAFAGDVQLTRLDGGVLRLRGRARDDGLPLTLWFSGSTSSTLPALLRDVSVNEESEAGTRQWRITAAGVGQIVHARSMQVHRGLGADWMRAVAPPVASLRGRIGWAILLNLLRIPGAGRLLATLRAN
jgi:hypothetical protein